MCVCILLVTIHGMNYISRIGAWTMFKDQNILLLQYYVHYANIILLLFGYTLYYRHIGRIFLDINKNY